MCFVEIKWGRRVRKGSGWIPVNRLPKGESGLNQLYGQIEWNAKRREYVFLLTKEEFRKLTSGNCFYCDAIPNQITYADSKHSWKRYTHNGIDRIDNTKGYIIDNCVSCCKTCNFAKSQMSQQEFLNWAERVHNHSILRGQGSDKI